MKDCYAVELARAVALLFADGCSDPSAEEIATAYFSGKIMGGEIIDGVRKRLKRIRTILEKDYLIPVYLVADYYYSPHCNRCPADSAQARKCICGGLHKSAAGVVAASDNDIIYQEALKQNIISSVPKTAKAVLNIINAMNEGRMKLEDGGDLLNQLKAKMEVDNHLKLTTPQDSLMQKAMAAAKKRPVTRTPVKQLKLILED